MKYLFKSTFSRWELLSLLAAALAVGSGRFGVGLAIFVGGFLVGVLVGALVPDLDG